MTKTKLLLILLVVAGFMAAAFFGLDAGRVIHNRKDTAAATESARPGKNPGQTAPTHSYLVSPEAPDLPPPEETVFTPMDFAYDGQYLTCLNYPYSRGIDVSRYQGDIDWEQVKEAGFEFVIIKVGARGYGKSGNLVSDPKALENYQNATAAGLKVGVYFFSQAISVEEATQEAAYVLERIDGWQLDMPVVYDWECLTDEYRTVDTDARTVTDCAKAFCDAVAEAGYEPMVYFNANQSRKQIYLAELSDYKFWLALYTDQMTYEYKVDMWQYTNEGRVPGIDGNVDINLYFHYEDTGA